MLIENIKPYEKNAKKHPKKQIEAVAKSIKEFGFNQPIVLDKDNVIIVGHGRFEASKLLGLKDVPTITVDLPEDKVKAYRLADNKLNESEWDMSLAIEELKELSDEMFNLTGFDSDLLISNDENDDDVPETPDESKSKIGDLYELESHVLLCGDSSSVDDLSKLMAGVKADMVFTDPPYNVAYSGRGENTSNSIMNDKMSDEAFTAMLGEWFKRFSENTKEGGAWYVFHSSSTQDQFTKAIEDTGWKVRTQIIWNKPTASMGWGDYRMKHEPMFYCGKENTQFYGDRTGTSIWDFHKNKLDLVKWAERVLKADTDGKTTIWTMKRENVNGYVHPTQKPVELIVKALVNSSKMGDIVLDLFGGSGSTMLACYKTGRMSRSMELDPKYVDVIVQRYVDYTGNENIKLNGKEIIWKQTEKKPN
jgi:site-specific DNA-methyltransferase (adenine-specific)